MFYYVAVQIICLPCEISYYLYHQ